MAAEVVSEPASMRATKRVREDFENKLKEKT